ncbi:beta-carotene 3-hydroxylase [Pantoea sp. PNA 14-12]|uniref:Beta-carotene hydroxylase n=1 Tax=Pantoea stewartii TaxID=66269 RepID=A0AB34VEX9_9GAMM|nr:MULTISPECIES: sterol desaturase family protein [Pantoea]KKW52316.1 beta-carotene hydroxylase [Pantoea ananatis]KGD79901.1 beta-carotene hydroxylase [Pantoea stewartii subsp. indologenes]KTS26301.1 beta-carotene hydroxylase [Pantoea stewartii]KTS73584.1 beta-carotene hydroxylase [Pantoea stewartii]KTS96616.1 beta-carotene hydroxylase [Pantoea stewartii]
MLWIWNALIVFITVVGMEVVAALAHKYIMHGWGWGWHLSHHEPRKGAFEVNDLYAVVFAIVSIALIYFGSTGIWPLQWIGAGMTAYGLLYFMVHDGLVHQRWPFRYIPRKGYLKRLYMAHRMHHAVRGKEGCVSFGFLYAPPLSKLQATLRERHAARSGAARDEQDGVDTSSSGK